MWCGGVCGLSGVVCVCGVYCVSEMGFVWGVWCMWGVCVCLVRVEYVEFVKCVFVCV